MQQQLYFRLNLHQNFLPKIRNNSTKIVTTERNVFRLSLSNCVCIVQRPKRGGEQFWRGEARSKKSSPLRPLVSIALIETL